MCINKLFYRSQSIQALFSMVICIRKIFNSLFHIYDDHNQTRATHFEFYMEEKMYRTLDSQ